eukprot:6016220-Amphidinium_carterae.1
MPNIILLGMNGLSPATPNVKIVQGFNMPACNKCCKAQCFHREFSQGPTQHLHALQQPGGVRDRLLSNAGPKNARVPSHKNNSMSGQVHNIMRNQPSQKRTMKKIRVCFEYLESRSRFNYHTKDKT